MKNDIAFLKHIMYECLFLIDFIEKTDFEDFISSEIYKRAAVRSIEIIGEASKKISDQTRNKFNEIEWNNLAKMRDVLVH